MEGQQQPVKLSDLLERSDEQLEGVYLQCIFCTAPLDFRDLVHFDQSELNILWRDEQPFGSCLQCCKKAGYLEFCNFYECTIPGYALESYTGNSLLDIEIRCFSCLGLLSLSQKLEHVWGFLPFHKVRNRWKGCCPQCRYDWYCSYNS